MRALLVVNPAATRATPRVCAAVIGALESEVKLDVVRTGHRWHAAELAHQARIDGLDLVVALGGDGTANEVVNGLLEEGPSAVVPQLAVLPAGSTNVLARSLGLPRDPVKALARVLAAVRAGRSRSIGLGQADGRWFTFCAGMGLDAEVVARVERRRNGRRRASAMMYAGAALGQFVAGTDRRPPVLTVERPGAAPERVQLGVVANTAPWTYLGRRAVTTCPDASFDAGLDLFGLRRLDAPTTLWHLAQALGRGPSGRRVLAARDLPRVTFLASAPVALQVDGDFLGRRQRVNFLSVPRALTVVC